jgi:hypothetical protein
MATVKLNRLIISAVASKSKRTLHIARAPRKPRGPQPLSEPATDSDEDYVTWFDKTYEESIGFVIQPSHEQQESWTVTYRGLAVPIGATGQFYPFGDKPQSYSMGGLSGCTAIIPVVSDITTNSCTVSS